MAGRLSWRWLPVGGFGPRTREVLGEVGMRMGSQVEAGGAGRVAPKLEQFVYNDAIVRAFLVVTVALGHRGLSGGHSRGGPIGAAQDESRAAVHGVRAVAAAAHECGDFRLRRQRRVCRDLSFDAAALQGPHVQRFSQLVSFLGLAGDYRGGRGDAAARVHDRQGICRTGVADRPGDCGGVGGLCDQLLRHAVATPRAAHVRGVVVLHRHDCDDRHTAHLQQPGTAGRVDEELPGVRRACRMRSCSGGTGTTPWASC